MQFYQKRRENCVKTHVILKKASFYACLTLFAGMAFPMPLWASQSTAIVQQHVKQITGIVNDTSGAPVIGANVVEVGSTNGTITDVDGKFTLNVSVGAKLKVSYIGYNDQQITVGNSNSYTIILKEDTESLDEVVVVGYGTQKKVNLTGSVATISSDKLVNRTSANVTNMLAGQMPGVTIIQNTGQPGADAGVLRVRGLGTMGDASAMVVVEPICPPLSMPSATTASAPARSIIFAIATLATTGMTFTPAFFHSSMNFPGFPAPVVTACTPSSTTIFATSSALGLSSMIFTPKGLSVSSLHLRISSRTTSGGAEAAPMMPKPPAFDTAAASLCSATHAMPPWKMGYSICRSSVIFVLIVFLILLVVLRYITYSDDTKVKRSKPT